MSAGYNYSEALAMLRAGHLVARAGWNGKGMWVRYVDLYNDVDFSIREKPCARGTWLPFLALKTADNGLVPWAPSQTDMLATDWQQVSM